MLISRPTYLFLALIAISIHLCAHARSDDRDKPIRINADTAELNDKTGISIYTGDVVITQGTAKLTGDVVTIHAPNNEVEKIIADGNLATYQETTDEGKVVYSEAEQIVYYQASEKIEMFRRVKITQEENVFRGQYVIYYVDTEIIEAGRPQSGERVDITIQPEKKNTNE